MTRTIPTVLAIVTLLSARDAKATSCIDHAWETMDVRIVGVTSNGEPVQPPLQLLPLDLLLNSSEKGRWILFTQKDSYDHGKFYEIAGTVQPTEGVSAYIEAASEWSLDTDCGYEVGYTPIVPGRYAFVEEHMGGGKVSKDIDDPVLSISADRLTATLEFSAGGVPYVATYRITCAYFDWTQPGTKNCALTGTAGKPGEHPIPEPLPSSPGRGCASCSMSPVSLPGTGCVLLGLLAALAWFVRMRAGKAPRRSP